MPRSAHTSMTIASRWSRRSRRPATMTSLCTSWCSSARPRLAAAGAGAAGTDWRDRTSHPPDPCWSTASGCSARLPLPRSRPPLQRGVPPRDMQADDLRDKYLLRISVRLSGSRVRYARLHRRKLMVSHLVGAEASSHEPTPLGRREAGCCRFAASSRRSGDRRRRLCWWACEDLNLGPLPYQIPRRITPM